MLVSHAVEAREEYEVDASEADDRRCRGMVVGLTNERKTPLLHSNTGTRGYFERYRNVVEMAMAMMEMKRESTVMGRAGTKRK